MPPSKKPSAGKATKPAAKAAKSTAADKAAPPTDAFDKPLGATLEGLARLGAFGGELFSLIDETIDGKMILFGREHYDLEILGRAYTGLVYWGVPRAWDAPTVDRHPIVIVNKQGSDPSVIAADLASFLGDIAYSPEVRGASRHEWERARRESIEDHGELVQQIGERLGSLPGVALPKEPWMAKRLPVVALQPRVAVSVRTEEDVEDVIEDAYTLAFKSLLFHPSADEIEVSKRGVAIRVALDAPEGTSDALEANAIVAGPLHVFREALRQNLPGAKIVVELVNDCLSDDEDDAWRRLKIAVVDQAKQPELFAQLLAKRKKR